METSQFDATLGGEENLPFSANNFKFTASRSIEIAAMSESILRPSKTKLIFQTLPVHMRRRVMSHNCKRLPIKLREGHLEQLKKSGLPPKQKRPSRKYRRRPSNLLNEYNRRQTKHIWLETHIWHAKRFHMVNRWGYRIADRPCDKAFRACYRASSAHCLLQDISYYTPIQVSGPVDVIADMFRSVTNKSCGLSIDAKAYIEGKREGSIHLYNPGTYPSGYIGKVRFIWISNDNSEKELWLFIHPSQIKEVESVLLNIKSPGKEGSTYSGHVEKKRKISNKYSNVRINIMSKSFNIFRLTGPKSQAVLSSTIKCLDVKDKIPTNAWFSSIKDISSLSLEQKSEYWENVKQAFSPSLLPPSLIIGLIIKDPRLSRPKYRSKAQNGNCEDLNMASLVNIPSYVSHSPIWNISLCKEIKSKQMTNAQFIEHITKTQLVPGEINEDDPEVQSIPIVLIQKPGARQTNLKKIGYGSGWDIIVPAGYGLPFWQTFVMFGGRPGGLRETENVAFETGECFLPPDSEAGKLEEKRIEQELKEKYFRRPPSKRVNFQKLAINSPFLCPWKILLSDWSTNIVNDFYILRNRKLLGMLQECIVHKKMVPHIDRAESCLVPIFLQIEGKGNLKQHAIICLPQRNDIKAIKTLFEPVHEDLNEKLRKEKRKQHLQLLKQVKRKRRKIKKARATHQNVTKKSNKSKPSEYVKHMRELWLPSNITTVRSSCSRPILGYVSKGAFSFTEAKCAGIGYIAFNALLEFLKSDQDQILVRNNSSRKYFLAKVHIVTDI
ncbi:ribonucleases P/MRP protein subunit POP1 [Battus philenor]|uniref:ribonucleases P/MRP protein subunit POP1 n=1 Tax=Battus philenor TaxID=42288 RepID=UPI0035D11499